MSLLWRNQLRISLTPERLVLAPYSRGFRPGKGRTQIVHLQPAPNDPEWRAAIDALPTVLAAHARHDVSVVLADQLVRYTLLSWSPALKSAEQWMSLARHRLAAVHGPAAAEWDIRLSETAPQGPRLACAVDRSLVDALAAQFAGTEARLVSVQPFLIAAFNRLRRKLGSGSCWLVIEEPGRLTLAFIQRGIWLTIRSRRADQGWREKLPELIERESAFLALNEPCSQVLICAQDAIDAARYETFRAQALDYRELALSWESA